MKVWKRCMAAVLAFMIFTTSVMINQAAGAYDKKNFIWTATDAEVVAEYYGLDDKETDALFSKAVNRGYEYILFAPYDNKTSSKKEDLIAVDYLNKKVYAKALHTGGCSWLPKAAVLSAEGEEKETITLTTGICYFDDVEYNASQAFTYDGHDYTVEVKYQLHVEISTEEQARLLQIPGILAQTANNLEGNLKGLRQEVNNLGELTPYLAELLTLELTKEQTVVKSVTEEPVEKIKDESYETTEIATVVTTEPAFDPVEHAAEIAAIQALSEQYTENNGLILYNMSEEYKALTSPSILSYTLDKGKQVLEQSAQLHEYVTTLKNSSRLKTVYKELSTLNPELYEQLRYLQTILKNLVGTARKPGELTLLKDETNWTILDEAVQERVFADKYSDEEFAQLEGAVYALRNSTPEMPQIIEEKLLAAEIGVTCDITIYDITITVNAEAVSGELEDGEVYSLEPYTASVTLLEGTKQDEIRAAIKECGIEKKALNAWNGANSHYQVNTSNYDRVETGISGDLYSDMECIISYSPKMYEVRTNFRGNAVVPYGFQMEFPVSNDEEISYDYVVETEDGAKVSYNEGVTYKVTKPIFVTQMEGSEKTEYRLYDFLINDVQYAMSDEAKQILSNAAVNSPTLKIRVPDGSTVGEVIQEDGGYRIAAESFAAGILGMAWQPYIASVMDGDTVLEEAVFTDGVATWTTGGFTHVRVSYRLKIEKVKDGILNRPVDETQDVLYALNLPHDLVTHTVLQNECLSGSEGVTAKVMYDEMASVSDMMNGGILGIIGGSVVTADGKDAVLRLQGSETKIIKGQKGQSLGYGAWNTANNELALYSYLKLCNDTKWSLAAYYQTGLCYKVAEQSGIVADCLEKIVADPGFNKVLTDFNMLDKKESLEKLIPQLKDLAEKIEGPHPALDIEDEGFAALIEQLLLLEGKTTGVETSAGIYAYTSIRRNGERGGSLTVSVQMGSKLAKTRELSYVMEDGSHVLTEAEAAQVQAYISELESLCGMTEEEKVYYDLMCTGIPQAGDSVRKNEIVSLTYLPKEYSVTIAGVPASEYEATFKYKSDYVIPLPPYSYDTEAEVYNRYWIDSEIYVKVANGSEGYYTFSKEDLTTIFVNDHYEISVEEIVMLEGMVPSPSVILNEGMIRGYDVDLENHVLYLDSAPKGLKVEQFRELINFTYGEDSEEAATEIVNSNRDPSRLDYLANGSEVYCTVLDENGDPHETVYTVIIMGDINKNGIVESNDMLMIQKNYLGNAEESELIYDTVSRITADMNRNGNYLDSNDALQILQKYMYWDGTSGTKYVSVLMK